MSRRPPTAVQGRHGRSAGRSRHAPPAPGAVPPRHHRRARHRSTAARERSARVTELAGRAYRTPDGRERRFSARTLWAWWSAYRRHGLAGLLPRRRKDRGTPLGRSPELLAAAIALRREVSSRSTATLIDILKTQQRALPGQLRRATLDRHLAAAGVSRRRRKTLGDKRYIRLLFERPNQFWVGDYHEAPLLWDPARQRYRTLHLCAVIDYYSRLVPHAASYATEQIATLEACLKQAILTRGLPDTLYVDNGAAYRADQFAFACAHLGITLRHSKPYASEGRGAIERWHRTVVDDLTAAYQTVGPFAEATTRVALEHALRVRGRGLHVSVYTHYLKVWVFRESGGQIICAA